MTFMFGKRCSVNKLFNCLFSLIVSQKKTRKKKSASNFYRHPNCYVVPNNFSYPSLVTEKYSQPLIIYLKHSQYPQ